MLKTKGANTFVGRGDELDQLVGTGLPCGFGIAGDAGVGKTRLVKEYLAAVDHPAVVAECLRAGSRPHPHSLISNVVLGIADLVDQEEILDQIWGSAKGDLARVCPGISDQESKYPLRPDEGTSSRLFEQLQSAIKRASDYFGGLVVVLEDLHWADESGGKFAALLAGATQRLGIGLLITYREDEIGLEHPIRPVIDQLVQTSDFEIIDLRPLKRDQQSQQIVNLVSECRVRNLEEYEKDSEHILDTADGNPLFAEELVAMKFAGGTELPQSASTIFGSRLNQLASEERRVVEAAALSELRISIEGLAQIAPAGR